MTPFSPPPAPPAAVIYEKSVTTETRRTSSDQTVETDSAVIYAICACAASKAAGQIQIADGTVTPRNVSKVIPMRAATPSLKKKIRQERMSAFEREYPW